MERCVSNSTSKFQPTETLYGRTLASRMLRRLEILFPQELSNVCRRAASEQENNGTAHLVPAAALALNAGPLQHRYRDHLCHCRRSVPAASSSMWKPVLHLGGVLAELFLLGTDLSPHMTIPSKHCPIS